MSETRSGERIDRDAVATMLQFAELAVEQERLDELAELLEAAGEAANHLGAAASRIPLSEALAAYDPAWPEAERRA